MKTLKARAVNPRGLGSDVKAELTASQQAILDRFAFRHEREYGKDGPLPPFNPSAPETAWALHLIERDWPGNPAPAIAMIDAAFDSRWACSIGLRLELIYAWLHAADSEVIFRHAMTTLH